MDLSHIPPRASFDWRSIPATPRDIWVCGVDLGQACDSTAICVMHYTRVPTENWVPNLKAETWKQQSVTRYDAVHLQRLPLGLSYVEQVQRVVDILAREPLRDRAELVVDQSGVGAGVCDLLDNAGLRPNRIVITAGLEATQHGARTWHVGKQPLISKLEAAMHTGELHIAEALHESNALREELKDFQRLVSAAGRTTWSARSGKHDDLILSLAISIWHATNRPFHSCEELRI